MNALLQTASGPSLALLRLTQGWHYQCCVRHGMQYIADVPSSSPFDTPKKNKITVIQDWLARSRPGDMAVYIDVDVLWMRPEVAICNAWLEGADVGAVKGKDGMFHPGVIFARNTPRTADFIAEWRRVAMMRPMERYASGFGLGEREQFQCVIERAKPLAMNARWNAYRATADEPGRPIVMRAWHGEPRSCTYRRIARELARLPELTSTK